MKLIIISIFRLGYADYLLKELGKQISGKINLIMYDIGCKVVAHWKVCNQTILISINLLFS